MTDIRSGTCEECGKERPPFDRWKEGYICDECFYRQEDAGNPVEYILFNGLKTETALAVIALARKHNKQPGEFVEAALRDFYYYLFTMEK